MFLTQREALASAEARAMAAETNARDQALLIEKLEHQIARLRHERFGQSSEWPRQGKVIQNVREKHSCRSCEKITPATGALASDSRGCAGPGLLAHVLFAKYGLHLPLTRQSATYAREGIELDVSTLADWVGATAATLMPLVEAVRTHVFAAERLHADDTTVPVLDVGRTRTLRLATSLHLPPTFASDVCADVSYPFT